jgi:hypothetical protein
MKPRRSRALSESKSATRARVSRARKRMPDGPISYCPCRRADSTFASEVGTCALCGHVYTGRLPNKLLYDDPVDPTLLERRLAVLADVDDKLGKQPMSALEREQALDRVLGKHAIDYRHANGGKAPASAYAAWAARDANREQEMLDAAVVKSPYAPKRKRRTKAA